MIKISYFSMANNYICRVKNSLTLTVFFLTTLILYNSFRVSATYTYYKLDPIGFIEALCVNKDKPEMECNGQCHLKKVAQSSTDDNNQPNQLLNFDELLLFNEGFFAYELNPIFLSANKLQAYYLNLYNFKFRPSYFHPPQV
ncbi:hypothetical protein GSB9_02263 [Flavobacteriaceae bacterium GSB9]|nr:hypothetical protein GSB9_02263 [Flavobacteriaceae bacterium GSB9]